MAQRSHKVENITRKQGRLWIVNRKGLKVGPARPSQNQVFDSPFTASQQ